MAPEENPGPLGAGADALRRGRPGLRYALARAAGVRGPEAAREKSPDPKPAPSWKGYYRCWHAHYWGVAAKAPASGTSSGGVVELLPIAGAANPPATPQIARRVPRAPDTLSAAECLVDGCRSRGGRPPHEPSHRQAADHATQPLEVARSRRQRPPSLLNALPSFRTLPNPAQGRPRQPAWGLLDSRNPVMLPESRPPSSKSPRFRRIQRSRWRWR